jgi:hypothetical protein
MAPDCFSLTVGLLCLALIAVQVIGCIMWIFISDKG